MKFFYFRTLPALQTAHIKTNNCYVSFIFILVYGWKIFGCNISHYPFGLIPIWMLFDPHPWKTAFESDHVKNSFECISACLSVLLNVKAYFILKQYRHYMSYIEQRQFLFKATMFCNH